MQQGHNFILKEISILKPLSHQHKKMFMNLMCILYIGRNIHLVLIDNGMPLLHTYILCQGWSMELKIIIFPPEHKQKWQTCLDSTHFLHIVWE